MAGEGAPSVDSQVHLKGSMEKTELVYSMSSALVAMVLFWLCYVFVLTNVSLLLKLPVLLTNVE